MNTSEKNLLNPLPNAPKNTNPQPNTTRNTTKEVVPKQLVTSTQKEKINQHKPPIAANAIKLSSDFVLTDDKHIKQIKEIKTRWI